MFCIIKCSLPNGVLFPDRNSSDRLDDEGGWSLSTCGRRLEECVSKCLHPAEGTVVASTMLHGNSLGTQINFCTFVQLCFRPVSWVSLWVSRCLLCCLWKTTVRSWSRTKTLTSCCSWPWTKCSIMLTTFSRTKLQTIQMAKSSRSNTDPTIISAEFRQNRMNMKLFKTWSRCESTGQLYSIVQRLRCFRCFGLYSSWRSSIQSALSPKTKGPAESLLNTCTILS